MVFPARQKGVSLFFALIALVVLSLGAISLFRSVDTGSLVAGNITFKQSATAVSDRAAEAAINWLQTNNTGSTLFNNNTAQGYYATSLDTLDPTGKKSTASTRALVDWNFDSCANAGTHSACLTPLASNTINDYTTNYIISRMCRIEGDPNSTANNCTKAIVTSGSESPKRGELKYGDEKRFAGVSGPYYRILVRTAGPKDTVSYTETYVYF